MPLPFVFLMKAELQSCSCTGCRKTFRSRKGSNWINDSGIIQALCAGTGALYTKIYRRSGCGGGYCAGNLCQRDGTRQSAEVLEESQRRAWLYRTAKNICIDRARRVQAEPPWEGETFQNDDLTKPMVMQLCGILEPQDRAMFWLRYFEDYTAAELGEMFGIPAATVRSRMLNARRRLQKYYPEIKR